VAFDHRIPSIGPRLGAVVILGALSMVVVAQSRPAVPESQPVSRDEALWQEILAANRALSATEPYSQNVEAALRPRRILLERARVYLSAYPGGRRRDEVVRLELKALFEIGTLSGGRYQPLQRQVEEYLRHPPSPAALYEAAYWKIRCERLARIAASSQPSSAPVTRDDPALHEAYRSYIQQYPSSRYVPRMATELFDAAVAAGDLAEQRRLVDLLGQHFKGHAVTELLAAQLRRHEAVGKPFGLTFQTADGTEIDTAGWKGRPVLIVVWAGFSERSRACVRAIEAFRSQQPDLQVVGVNLDDGERKMTAACDELGLTWPQYNDGMGWANRFARQWGVREVPCAFVVDRRGRLVGSSGAAGWRELALSALEN
jgi:hypothetical protein